MKLLDALRQQVKTLGKLRRAWFTTFNLSLPFFETHVLPVLLEADTPVNRMDFENMQLLMAESGVDLRIFCDLRMMEADQLKRTALLVHGVLPQWFGREDFDKESLFHPKVIFLEDEHGRMVLGTGSANLTVSGWGRNQEVFIFRQVSSNDQYQQIKRFFEPLLAAAGVSGEPLLGVRRRFHGKDAAWRFVHSFERQSFLQALLANTHAERLTVWSPYFSRDLAALLAKIRELGGGDLNFSIVPDRVGNRHLRTPWSDGIQGMLDNDELVFHDRPLPRGDAIEMTHAKLWLASGRQACLAVGSWNCTSRGSASFDLRNVEAGILLNVPPGTEVAGLPLKLSKKDFSDEEMLEEEELELPPYLLPFELHVHFDWEQGRYEVQGWLQEDIAAVGYTLRLPGVKRPLKLEWKARRINGALPLEPITLELADNEALLADHSYQVWCDGAVAYRGLVIETGQAHRRAQGYDSLKDLLNDLVNGIESGSSGTSGLRTILRNVDLPDDRPAPLPLGVSGEGLSYFRLFHAFEKFGQRLRESNSRPDLERLLFVMPGSLQELVCKVNEQVAASVGSAVFRWMLLQEADSLYALALVAYDRTRAKYERKASPKSAKWDSLKPNKRGVRLPQEIRSNGAYMRQLREACGYGR
ncbi:phospholipase D-like domain-containing protein [Achromobacter spanius]|uniref:phospholipase D-like domain-containing protein n=1 Tax=Achromobacter spanius TaxID=217203 RepID=UPI00320AD635